MNSAALAAATTPTLSWSKTGYATTAPVPGPDGDVLVGQTGCGASDLLNASGQIVRSVTPGCGKLMDAAGTYYYPVQSTAICGSGRNQTLAAVTASGESFTFPTVPCDEAFIFNGGNFTLGADGNVYQVSSPDGYYNGQWSKFNVLRFDPTSRLVSIVSTIDVSPHNIDDLQGLSADTSGLVFQLRPSNSPYGAATTDVVHVSYAGISVETTITTPAAYPYLQLYGNVVSLDGTFVNMIITSVCETGADGFATLVTYSLVRVDVHGNQTVTPAFGGACTGVRTGQGSLTPSGDLEILGTTGSGSPHFVFRLDATGNVQWQTQVQGNPSYIVVDDNGNTYVIDVNFGSGTGIIDDSGGFVTQLESGYTGYALPTVGHIYFAGNQGYGTWHLDAYDWSSAAGPYPQSDVIGAGGPTTVPPAVTPPSGPAGTRFTATWSCPSGSASSIVLTDQSGGPVFGTQLPTSGNGVDYVDGFTAPLATPVGSTFTATASCNGQALTPVDFDITAPAHTVMFVQGIGSSSTCPDSSDFVGRLDWLRNSLIEKLGSNTKFLYYAYRSPSTSSPSCGSDPDIPSYNRLDSCWSLDDAYSVTTGGPRGKAKTTTYKVAGGGEASRMSVFLRAYVDANPNENISIITHSQGGVLSTYTVQQKLTGKYASYAAHIKAIVTLDSPLGGINSQAAGALRAFAHCTDNGNPSLESSSDMLSSSSVIQAINSTRQQTNTALYTIDANPGDCGDWCASVTGLSSVPLIDDTHSTVWWAASHIQIGAETHSDIWDGCFLEQGASAPCTAPTGAALVPEGRALVNFAACGIAGLSADCASYARQS